MEEMILTLLDAIEFMESIAKEAQKGRPVSLSGLDELVERARTVSAPDQGIPPVFWEASRQAGWAERQKQSWLN